MINENDYAPTYILRGLKNRQSNDIICMFKIIYKSCNDLCIPCLFNSNSCIHNKCIMFRYISYVLYKEFKILNSNNIISIGILL